MAHHLKTRPVIEGGLERAAVAPIVPTYRSYNESPMADQKLHRRSRPNRISRHGRDGLCDNLASSSPPSPLGSRTTSSFGSGSPLIARLPQCAVTSLSPNRCCGSGDRLAPLDAASRCFPCRTGPASRKPWPKRSSLAYPTRRGKSRSEIETTGGSGSFLPIHCPPAYCSLRAPVGSPSYPEKAKQRGRKPDSARA
jgi:hypothetical protein